MQQLYAWSGLWRPLSFQIFSHRLVLLCMLSAFLIAGCLYFYLAEQDVGRAASFGLGMGLAVFISWALARELDPDAPWAAFVVVGLSTIALWLWPNPDLVLLFFILLMLRLVNRSSGVPARLADVLLLIAYTTWLLYQGQLIAGVLATAAFWSNSKPPEAQPSHKYWALLSGLLTILAITLEPFQGLPGNISIEINILVIAFSTAFALFARTIKEVNEEADATEAPLSLHRLRSAQVIVLLIVTIFTLWQGDVLFTRLSLLWAAFGGIFLYHAFYYKPAPKHK